MSMATCRSRNVSSTVTMSERKEWRVDISQFAARTHNPIRSLVESMHIQPNPDKQMIALSIGDPTTFGNLRPPAEAVDAVLSSAASGAYDGYAPSAGYQEARQAVAAYSSTHGLKVEAQDVVLCSGCSSALDLCISALAGPGSNILIPRPGFSIYRTLAEGLGVTVRYYDLNPDENWECDVDQLEREIDVNTVCIVVNNPSNPCGSVYSPYHLNQLLDVASRHYLPIVADEIYEHLVFPGCEYHPIASLSRDVPILSCSGLTKRFLVPGWRMGWIIIHDRHGALTEVRLGLNKLSQRVMGSNTLVQAALPAILKDTPNQFFHDTITTLHRHATLAYSRLSKLAGLTPVMPQGAMYMMVRIDMAAFPELSSSISFVERLVREESVFCLPGDCFQCPCFVRLVLTAPEPMLEEACDRIERFCRKHYSPVPYTTNTNKKPDMTQGFLARDGKRSENSGREP